MTSTPRPVRRRNSNLASESTPTDRAGYTNYGAVLGSPENTCQSDREIASPGRRTLNFGRRRPYWRYRWLATTVILRTGVARAGTGREYRLPTCTLLDEAINQVDPVRWRGACKPPTWGGAGGGGLHLVRAGPYEAPSTHRFLSPRFAQWGIKARLASVNSGIHHSRLELGWPFQFPTAPPAFRIAWRTAWRDWRWNFKERAIRPSIQDPGETGRPFGKPPAPDEQGTRAEGAPPASSAIADERHPPTFISGDPATPGDQARTGIASATPQTGGASALFA